MMSGMEIGVGGGVDWGPMFGYLFVTRGLTFDHLPVCFLLF